MDYALTAGQTRALEDASIASGAVTLGDLMERAGAALATEVTRRAPSGEVAVVCGPGNNGGDGWVAARLLLEGGRRVRVFSLVAPESLKPPPGGAARAAIAAGVPFEVAGDGGAAGVLRDASVIIDALYGFGFHGALGEQAGVVAAAINAAGALVISADVPSGVNADTGAADAGAVRAGVTVTFTALKRGLLLHPGAGCAGEIVVADVGLPEQADAGTLEVPAPGDFRATLPWPQPGDHKGVRGRVAVIAGSAMYSGAAVLAVSGALRMGAGYVYAVVPEPIADVLRTTLPGAIVRGVPATHEGSMARVDAVLTAIADADALVVGPGLTVVPSVGEIVRALMRDASVPMVLDADALNVLSAEGSPLDAARASVVLTPHPGEAARLLGCDVATVMADRPGAVQRLAAERRTCLLKGPGTLVAGGGRMGLIRAGNAGLARAGSGDVLAGMIGTLLAQRVAPYDAALLAAHLHGRAAEFGAAVLTETCFTASDITGFLPDAVREVASG